MVGQLTEVNPLEIRGEVFAQDKTSDPHHFIGMVLESHFNVELVDLEEQHLGIIFLAFSHKSTLFQDTPVLLVLAQLLKVSNIHGDYSLAPERERCFYLRYTKGLIPPKENSRIQYLF